MRLSEAIAPHLQPFNEIVVGGFGDYGTKYSAEVKQAHDSSCRAKIRHCHMFERATLYAKKHSRDVVDTFDVHKLRGLLIANYAAVIFKRFDANLLTRNNPTSQIRSYRNQRQIAGIPALVYLIAGYQDDDETGELTSVYLTRPSGQRGNRWELRLDGQAPEMLTTPLFEAEEQEETGADVRPRREPAEVIPLVRETNNDKDKS